MRNQSNSIHALRYYQNLTLKSAKFFSIFYIEIYFFIITLSSITVLTYCDHFYNENFYKEILSVSTQTLCIKFILTFLSKLLQDDKRFFLLMG